MAATKGDKKAGQRSPVRLLLNQILIMLLLSVCIVALALALLDLYTLHGKVTVVPDIVGKSMADAEKMLKKQHLTYEIVDSIYTEDALPGSIQDVQPKAGSKVKPNPLHCGKLQRTPAGGYSQPLGSFDAPSRSYPTRLRFYPHQRALCTGRIR